MSNEAMLEDEFASFAKAKEDEAKNRGSSGGFSGGDYENPNYTGLVPEKVKILRCMGGVPDSGRDQFTARTINISWIVGDNGKKMRVILPIRGTDAARENVFWQIINRVNETVWINKKRVNINESKNPDIFNLINFNGLKEGDKKRMFDRGWMGREMLVMNVLDREQMAWHRENKHSMILSRNIGEGADGTLYPEEGVPAYGFLNLLSTTLFKHYGSWEKYDIGVVRTGQKDTPYRLFNAGKFALADMAELPADLRPLVSQTDHLTDEELSWERYDFDKIFKITSYTKILNRLKYTIGKIDSVFGTTFLKEIEDLAAKEKAEWDAAGGASENTQAETEKEKPSVSSAEPENKEVANKVQETAQQAPAKTRATREPVTETVTKDFSNLPGWPSMTDKEKSEVVDVVEKNGKISDIKFNSKAELVACPSCNVASPEDHHVCAACGLVF